MADRIVTVDGVTSGYETLAAAQASELAIGGDLGARLGAPARLIYDVTRTTEETTSPAIGTGFSNGTIIVRAGSGNTAGTAWDTGKYVLRSTGGVTHAITVDTSGGCDVEIRGLQLECRKTSGSSATRHVFVSAAVLGTTVTVKDCLLLTSASDAGGPQGGIASNSINPTWKVGNNIAIGHGVAGAFLTISNTQVGAVYAHHNTVHTMATAIAAGTSGKVVASNNIASASTGTAYTGTFNAASRNCLSTTASVPLQGTGHLASTAVKFVATAAGSEDLALASDDTGAQNAGVDLTADPNYPITTDILGTTRVAPVDIGAFEIGTAVVADRVEWAVQPAASYYVGETLTATAKAVEGAGGPTQTDLNTGTASLYWSDDLVNALQAVPWVNGLAAFSYALLSQDKGTDRTLVVVADNGTTALTDAPASDAVTVADAPAIDTGTHTGTITPTGAITDAAIGVDAQDGTLTPAGTLAVRVLSRVAGALGLSGLLTGQLVTAAGATPGSHTGALGLSGRLTGLRLLPPPTPLPPGTRRRALLFARKYPGRAPLGD